MYESDLGRAPSAKNRARSTHQEPTCVVQKVSAPAQSTLRAIDRSSAEAQPRTIRCPNRSFRTAESFCRQIRT
eukprot:5440111-Pleurochrysis_carterae.AAC.1